MCKLEIQKSQGYGSSLNLKAWELGELAVLSLSPGTGEDKDWGHTLSRKAERQILPSSDFYFI